MRIDLLLYILEKNILTNKQINKHPFLFLSYMRHKLNCAVKIVFKIVYLYLHIYCFTVLFTPCSSLALQFVEGRQCIILLANVTQVYVTFFMLCFSAQQIMIKDNHNVPINTFINNQNFTDANNLTDLLGNDDATEEVTQVKLSPYVDMHELSEKLFTAKSNLSIPSLNAQSINAKFDEFQIAINAINKKQQISVICTQESWLSSECSTKLFELSGYQLISKGKYCSNYGGLLMYVHNDYLWEHITIKEQTTGWENLFIKVRHKSPGSKINIIGNIYRVPKELLPDFHIFQEEFEEAFEILRTNKSLIYLCGDFNIDLLKIKVKEHYSTFYNCLVSAGYLPRICLLTRVTNHSATLLDNIII